MNYFVYALHHRNPVYRGVYRTSPDYREDLPESSLYNQSFLRLVRGEYPCVDTLDEALEIATNLDPTSETSDVIGVEPCQSETQVPSLIGYDVASHRWYSFLDGGVRWTQEQKAMATVGPMFNLMERYFSPRLNQYGLFPDYELARLFCDVLESMQTFVPDIWESPGTYHPEVLAIHGFRLANADEH